MLDNNNIHDDINGDSRSQIAKVFNIQNLSSSAVVGSPLIDCDQTVIGRDVTFPKQSTARQTSDAGITLLRGYALTSWGDQRE